MYRPGRLSAALLLTASSALVPALASVARAQDAQAITPEQTTSLAHALNIYESDQIARLFGPGTDRITPEGDHYLVKFPLNQGRDDALVSGDDVTFHAKPLDENRWSLDTMTLPPDMTVGAKGDANPLHIGFTTTGLDYHAIIDSTQATPGSSDLALATMHAHVTKKADKPGDADIDLTIDGGHGEAHGATTAAVDGLVDMSSTAAFSDIAVTTSGASPSHFSMGKVTADMTLGGVSAEQMRALTQAANKLSEEAKSTPAATAPAAADGTTPSPAKPPLTDEQKATLKTMLDAARGSLRTINLTEELDDFAVNGGDNTTFKIGKLKFVTIGAAPDGKLDAREEMTMDGLTISDAGLGAAGKLIPKHVVLTPHVTGLSLDDTMTLIQQAIDNPNADPSTMGSGFTQLLSHGPVRVSIDQLAFDVGPSAFEATGAVDVTSMSPTANVITADVKATGLGALMSLMSSDPQLKSGVAGIVFAKGIGKQDGDTVTWHIVYKDGHLTVNGTDMTQLMPH